MNSIGELFDYAIKVTTDEVRENIIDPADWIEAKFIDPITMELMVLQDYQRRIIRQALTMDAEGRSKYSLVVWSQTKKSGKTTVAAAVGAYVANNIEPPNEISCVANDKEQSAGRIWGNMVPTMRSLGWAVPPSQKGERNNPIMYGGSGSRQSVVKAITTNYEKEAGGNQGLSLWSELWAYKGERLTRLWEEMTPPPTRKFSMRWVETYAGFIGENLLLQSIYQRVFQEFYKAEDHHDPDKEIKLQPGVVQLWDDLPVYEVEDHMLVFWDHEHRMPWQTEAYYRQQRNELRESSYRRLHKNEWADSGESFITNAMWMNSLLPDRPTKRATYALDAAKNNDCAALVGTARVSNVVVTKDVHIWEPVKGGEIDFGVIEEVIMTLWKQGKLRPPLWYDPYQCVKLAQDLRQKGIPCQEFPQGALRIKADTFLYKLYNEGRIINPNHPKLRQHVTAASVKEYADQRIRIIKPSYDSEVSTETSEKSKTGDELLVIKKVDGAVAQSMSAYQAYQVKSGGWADSGI